MCVAAKSLAKLCQLSREPKRPCRIITGSPRPNDLKFSSKLFTIFKTRQNKQLISSTNNIMDLKKLLEVESKEYMPGFHGRMIHTESMTFAYWDIEPGSSVHEHHHHHEQVVNMLEGEFELVVDGVSKVLQAGDIIVIPGNVPHSGTAISQSKILDVFCPVREDYI
jgi:quercetin dioxygenase-like cupin family protein